MLERITYHFSFDPAGSFGDPNEPGSFRDVWGNSCFKDAPSGISEEHPDVLILASLGRRIVRDFQTTIPLSGIPNKVTESIRSITKFRDAFKSAMDATEVKPTVFDSNGKQIPVEDAVWRVQHAVELDVVNTMVGLFGKKDEIERPFGGIAIQHKYLSVAALEVDRALVKLKAGSEGITTNAVVALDAIHHAETFMTESTVRKATLSEWGRKAISQRLSVDPRQADKKFVHECWLQWRQEPARYKSKAAFARDMLEKCAHLESNKVIETWCREWEKAEANR